MGEKKMHHLFTTMSEAEVESVFEAVKRVFRDMLADTKKIAKGNTNAQMQGMAYNAMVFAQHLALLGKEKRAELEKRVAALEQNGSVEWAGTHAAGKHYRAGNLVTRTGSLWLAKSPTRATPGQSPDWQLVVKRGKAT